jgi:oligopeptide transport system ATP-binding protein
MNDNNIIEVRDLETTFKTDEGIIHAVNGISFDVKEGETLGIVGESGCGKSVTMLSMMQLIPSPPGKITNGEVVFQDNDLLKMSLDEIRHIRGSQISMIFQDPMTSFNPVIPIGKQITEPLEIHLDVSKKEAVERAVELLTLTGIPNVKERLRNYPYQFSGGMRQRAMIAMALICTPKLLIADEPTTALDVTIQAQIIDLVKRLRDEIGMSVIWITHDLGIIAGLAQRVIVMYSGYIVEEGPVKSLYASPKHPYTIGLLGSLPKLTSDKKERLTSIDGVPPVLLEKPNRCPFAPRCKYVVDHCWEENPPLFEVNRKQKVACWVDVDSGRER